MQRLWATFLFFLMCLGVSQVRGADRLEIIVVDTEGGKAVILVTPKGESLLVDAGYPRDDDRDTNRIVAAAEAARIKRFDYIVATHYDLDHSGNVARVDARIPGRVFVDHGPAMPEGALSESYKSYLAAIGTRRRLSPKPGEVLPVKDVRITVVSSGGAVLSRPVQGGDRNPLCGQSADAGKPASDASENAGSLGLLYEFGRFRMLDLADLLVEQERRLMCPVDRIGQVSLFMVSHHGFKVSNSAVLIHALKPRVAVMNNGPSKGGEAEVFDVLRSSLGFGDLWQLHFSPAAGAKNAPAALIANLQESCGANAIRVSALRDGSFVVTNTRSGLSKTYPAR